jgi:hypothetical protein
MIVYATLVVPVDVRILFAKAQPFQVNGNLNCFQNPLGT